MNKKGVSWILVGVVVSIIIILSGILIIIFDKEKTVPENCPNLTSYKGYKVPPESVPIKNDGRNCPNRDYAKEKWIEEPNQEIVDAGWSEFIYCEEDKLFWIAMQKGEVPPDEYGSMVDYYGPFDGEPCLIEEY